MYVMKYIKLNIQLMQLLLGIGTLRKLLDKKEKHPNLNNKLSEKVRLQVLSQINKNIQKIISILINYDSYIKSGGIPISGSGLTNNKKSINDEMRNSLKWHENERDKLIFKAKYIQNPNGQTAVAIVKANNLQWTPKRQK